MMDMGHLNCVDLRWVAKKRGDEGSDVNELSNLYAMMSSFGNEKISIEDGVSSFLNWASKNPRLGKTNAINHAYLYLADPFPCKPSYW